MPPKKAASDFVLAAFELANDPSEKLGFLTALAGAVWARPHLARTGYPVAVAAATDQNKDIRGAAFNALHAILEKQPLLADPAAMQMLARAYVYEAEVKDEASRATWSAFAGNPGYPDAALPVLIDAINSPDVHTRNVAYEHFSNIVVNRPERAESLIPIIKATMADAEADMRIKALFDADVIIINRPELVDDDLLFRVAKMAANDQEPGHREEAADILNEFAKKHPRRADDLLPNRRLQQLTARLQVIAAPTK